MILLLVAALIGTAVTCAALWPYGMLIALIAAPFGGSALIVLTGAVLFVVHSYQDKQAVAEHTGVALQQG
jgi:hypothetical protein